MGPFAHVSVSASHERDLTAPVSSVPGSATGLGPFNLVTVSSGHQRHLRAAPASAGPAPGPAAALAPSAPAINLNHPMPLKAAEQGFEGKHVQHVNGSTMTADWRREFGPKGPKPYVDPNAQADLEAHDAHGDNGKHSKSLGHRAKVGTLAAVLVGLLAM